MSRLRGVLPSLAEQLERDYQIWRTFAEQQDRLLDEARALVVRLAEGGPGVLTAEDRTMIEFWMKCAKD